MPWQITYDGHVWSENDLSIDDCEKIEVLVGESWLTINPFRSAKHCRVLIEYLLTTREGMSQEDAQTKVRAEKIKNLLDGKTLKVVDDDLPTEFTDGNPPPAVDPSTDT